MNLFVGLRMRSCRQLGRTVLKEHGRKSKRGNGDRVVGLGVFIERINHLVHRSKGYSRHEIKDISDKNNYYFMKFCITCGMPLEGNHAGDLGLELPEGPVCKFDVENGRVKNGEAIFEGGVEFFAGAATDGDRDLAERITRKNMKMLPYWQTHSFAMLEEGPVASEEEFAAAMAKM
jgi:hypothetical protein